MNKLFLILFLTIIPFKVFGKDIDLVCKINKESFSVTEGLMFVPRHPLNYRDKRINRTYYYRINFEDKKVINLDEPNRKFLYKDVSIYKNRRIDLQEYFKKTPQSKELINLRVHINRHTGEFWSNHTVGIPINNKGGMHDYNSTVEEGTCSKSKKLF